MEDARGVYRRPFVSLTVTEMVAKLDDGTVVATAYVAPKDEEAMQESMESFLESRYPTTRLRALI